MTLSFPELKNKNMGSKKCIVFVQGAYDIINWGHVKSLELAKSFGDHLIVGLNSNELIRKYKQREPVLPWYQKRDILLALKWVDEVVEAKAFSPIKLLEEHDVDVYCMTEEWLGTKKAEMKFMALKPDGKVKILPRFEGVVPTSKIKEILLSEAKDGYMK